MTRKELGLDQGETRATRLLQPSPYSDRGSAEALALAGQSGALWREVKRLSAELQEVRRERDRWREAGRAVARDLDFGSLLCCQHPDCKPEVATVHRTAFGFVLCDRHGSGQGGHLYPWAIAWRRLVALAREGS